jgi:RNA polymerase sigma factor (sigma-70 family)
VISLVGPASHHQGMACATEVGSADNALGFPRCARSYAAELAFVSRALRRQGVGPGDAEDLAQDVFLVVWRRRADFDAKRPLRPWLAGIAFRVAQDHLKRRWREVPIGQPEAEDASAPLEDHVAVGRARALALEALATLPEKYRTPFVMHDLDDVPVQELAALLAIPQATAYTRLRRARFALADAMQAVVAARAPRAAP